jgi:hypothetical protein
MKRSPHPGVPLADPRVKASQVGPHDVASRVDPSQLRIERRARYIDFRELRPGRKVSSIIGSTGSRDPRH